MESIIKKREYWIDILRGFSIFLVILNHWNKYVVELQPEVLFKYLTIINKFFGPFRMEILFFLSGLLVEKSLIKGNKVYVIGKLRALMYPYFIWGGLILINNIILQYNEGVTYKFILIHILRYFTLTYFLVWFLGFLLIYYLIIPYLRKYSIYTLFLFLFLSFVLNEFFYYLKCESFSLGDFFYYFCFFLTGDYIMKMKIDIKKKSNNFYFLIMSMLSIIIVTYLIFKIDILKTSAYLYPLIILSFIVFIKIASLIENYQISKIFIYLGINSIVFYLTHHILMKDLAIFFKTYTSNDNEVIISLGIFIVGMFICYIINELRFRKYFISKLYKL